jgi:hypothetical protein
MTINEFNAKYINYLEKGHYGLDLDKPEAIEYLDKKFQEFIKIPEFSYSQIKSKFNYFSFYCSGISVEEVIEVQNKLKEIYNSN